MKRALAGLAVVVAGMLASGRRPCCHHLRQPAQPRAGELGRVCVRGPGPCTLVSFIHPIDPNGDPYSGGAPVGGVITKFRIRAFGEGGTAARSPSASPTSAGRIRRTQQRGRYVGRRRADGDDPGASNAPRDADPGSSRPASRWKGNHPAPRRDQRLGNGEQQRRQVHLRVPPPLVVAGRACAGRPTTRASCSSTRTSSPTPTATASATRRRTAARAKVGHKARVTRPGRGSAGSRSVLGRSGTASPRTRT